MNEAIVERSFNSQSNFDKSIKILIVGTFTSPLGIYNGYFYGAPRNCIYRRLDELFNTGNIFQTLKKKLIETNDKKEVVEQINKELSERNTAFFDVVEECVRKIPCSPYDKDLEVIKYSLDMFKEKSFSLKFIIFTSKNAREWFRNNGFDKYYTLKENNHAVLNMRGKNNVEEVKNITYKFINKGGINYGIY